MKVVIPVAGKGTRLLPLTNDVPKPLLRVAGRPVMDYVIDKLDGLDIEELIFITGHLKEQVEAHVKQHYRLPSRFVEQVVQDGTAGAINLARPYVNGPILIVFVDTLFDADLTLIKQVDADGVMWVKEVEDYQRFGVVVTDDQGNMTRIVEKPSEPISRLANIGLYYVRDWKLLFDGIENTLARPQNKGEWYLTDAFQYMIDHGSKIKTAEVAGWYDCGKIETLLQTNLHLLQQGRATRRDYPRGVTIVDPVRIAEGVELEACTIGPNVSMEAGTMVRDSVLSHAIVGREARIVDSTLEHVLIGDRTEVAGRAGSGLVAAGGEISEAH
ncbi:MAG: NTP transferase domain-containing protein [Gemmatimonadetes bacterium]|nr:NTP transferase domain-containing protein [Gemmatimonadota bacterium]